MSEAVTGSLGVSGSIPAQNFVFLSDGKRCLIISNDGTITTGEGFTPTEAGIAAIEAMRHHLQFIIAAEREACAKIAETPRRASDLPPELLFMETADRIASLIRARKGNS
jgi:hypothetical protein